MGRHHYGHRYKKLRASLLGLPCELQLVCEGDPADSADHTPPLSRHEHHEGSGCCRLQPACMQCQHEQARLLSMETKRLKSLGLHPSQIGPVDQLVQSVEWL
jgi:hypothetical protein